MRCHDHRRIRDGYTPLGLGGFSAVTALSTNNENPTKASRPWDKDRDGFVLGDGAGVLVLEEYEHAKARSANIFAEVTGFGMSSDAFHMTAPAEDGKGAKQAMISALKDADLDSSKIDYINAHGTSTPLGDIIEANAIADIFLLSRTYSCFIYKVYDWSSFRSSGCN